MEARYILLCLVFRCAVFTFQKSGIKYENENNTTQFLITIKNILSINQTELNSKHHENNAIKFRL